MHAGPLPPPRARRSSGRAGAGARPAPPARAVAAVTAVREPGVRGDGARPSSGAGRRRSRTASRSTGTYAPSVCGAAATHARRCARSRTTECEAIEASMALRFPGPRSLPSAARRSRRMATADSTSRDPPAAWSRTSRRARLFRDVDPAAKPARPDARPDPRPRSSRRAAHPTPPYGERGRALLDDRESAGSRVAEEDQVGHEHLRGPQAGHGAVKRASFRRTSARRSVMGVPEAAVSPPAIAWIATPSP